MDVTVRRLVEDDAEALSAAVAASREHLAPWMAWAREPLRSVAGQRQWIRERVRDADAGGDEAYGVFTAGRLAGVCGLHRRIAPGGLEIGYWIHVDHLRRGLATAAVGDLVARAFARPSIRRLEIHHDAANVASGRVAAAAGFTHVEDRADTQDGPPRTERIWRRER